MWLSKGVLFETINNKKIIHKKKATCKCFFQISHGKRKLYKLSVNFGFAVLNIKTLHKDMIVKFFSV